MIVEATFIGQPSLGYIRLRKYRLILQFHENYQDCPISITRMYNNKPEKGSECPYETFEAFLKNWTAIKTDYL